MAEQHKKLSHFAELDGIRGLMALWVLVAHCQIWSGVTSFRVPDPKMAVDVFMILSGFLMSHQARVRNFGGLPGETVTFWVRRFFRIAPVYYVILATVFLFHGLFAAGAFGLQELNRARWPIDSAYAPNRIIFDTKSLFAHLTFIFGLIPKYSYSTFTGDWSIGLEMQFYALFPVLWLTLRRFKVIWVVLGSILLFRISAHFVAGRFTEPSFLPLKVHIFIAGMLLYEASYIFRKDERRGVTVLLGTVLLCSFASVPAMVILAIVAIFAFVNLENYRAVALIKDSLSGRVGKFFGDVSYDVYLLHSLVICLLGLVTLPGNPEFRFLVMLLVVAPTSYLLAFIAHKLIEGPGIELGKTVARLSTGSWLNT